MPYARVLGKTGPKITDIHRLYNIIIYVIYIISYIYIYTFISYIRWPPCGATRLRRTRPQTGSYYSSDSSDSSVVCSEHITRMTLVTLVVL